MKKRINSSALTYLVYICFIFGVLSCQPKTPPEGNWEGTWYGVYLHQEQEGVEDETRSSVKITRDQSGELAATFCILDKDMIDTPTRGLSISGREIGFSVKLTLLIKIGFQGTLQQGDSSIVGTFFSGKEEYPIVMNRVEQIPPRVKKVVYVPEDVEPYVSYLKESAQPPLEYVLDLFERYDMVILGERTHPETTQWDYIYQLTSDPRFLEKVGAIFTEYGSISLQPMLESLMNTPGLEEKEVEERIIDILRDFGIWVGWNNNNIFGYLKKHYAMNQSLPTENKLHLYFSDIPWNWETMTKKDYKSWQEYDSEKRDKIMADRIAAKFREILDSDAERKKALVIMNTRHAYGPVSYQSGRFANNTGGYLFREFPGKVANVMFNYLKRDFGKGSRKTLLASDGKWDAAFWLNGDSPAAFDFQNSPFGRDRFDYHLPHYSHLNYEDVFTGMIFYQPLNRHMLQSGIPGFYAGEFKEIAPKRAKMVTMRKDYDKTVKQLIEMSENNPGHGRKRKEHHFELEFKPGGRAEARLSSSEIPATPIMVAVEEGNANALRAVLASSADANGTPGKSRTTTLMIAASNGHAEIVKMLLDAGADVDAKGMSATTALMIAASGGQTEVAKVLLEAGAELDELNTSGQSALMQAVSAGHGETVQVLLDTYPDADAGSRSKDISLRMAAPNGQTEIVKRLLQAGADVNCTNSSGANALIDAVYGNHLETARALVQAGADVNLKMTDRTGKPTIMFVRGIEMLKLLIDANADVNAKSKIGETALMRAANGGKADMVQILIDAGASLSEKNKKGLTALDLAEQNGRAQIVKMLKEVGAEQ